MRRRGSLIESNMCPNKFNQEKEDVLVSGATLLDKVISLHVLNMVSEC